MRKDLVMQKILKLLFLKNFEMNMLIFIFFSLVITFIRLPERFYNYKNGIYKGRKWEKSGKFYQSVFKIKSWKNHIPELADFVKFIFPKKSIKEFTDEFLSKYLLESCKAEFVHWCNILASTVFLIYEGISTFTYMFIIAIILNTPFILIQRYNRPRIISIMKTKCCKRLE